MKTDTPDTDARIKAVLEDSLDWYGIAHRFFEFSRCLERERNKAAFELEKVSGALTSQQELNFRLEKELKRFRKSHEP